MKKDEIKRDRVAETIVHIVASLGENRVLVALVVVALAVGVGLVSNNFEKNKAKETEALKEADSIMIKLITSNSVIDDNIQDDISLLYRNYPESEAVNYLGLLLIQLDSFGCDDTGKDGCFDDNETGYVYLLDENGELNFINGSYTNKYDTINSYGCGECQINFMNVTDTAYFIYEGEGREEKDIIGLTDDAVCDLDPNRDNWLDGKGGKGSFDNTDGNGRCEWYENTDVKEKRINLIKNSITNEWFKTQAFLISGDYYSDNLDYKSAELDYNNAIKYASSNAQKGYCYYKLGNVYFEMNDLSKALDSYKKADDLFVVSKKSESLNRDSQFQGWVSNNKIALHHTENLLKK